MVDHLLYNCHADTTKKDRNGLTPMELASKKSQVETEWALRRYMHKSTLNLVLSIGLRRLFNSR